MSPQIVKGHQRHQKQQRQDLNRPTFKRQESEKRTTAKMATRSLLILLLVWLPQPTSQLQAAVVRPTIFSDLGSQSSSSSNGQQPPMAPAQPPPQQQQSQLQLQQHPQSDGPQTPAGTKINPLKSRLCQAAQAQPLGLQSMRLPDAAISASSYSSEQVRPHLARLNLDLLGGAWCPGKPISTSNAGREWIQVKLNRSHVVTAVETQGRFAAGAGKEFAPSYQVEYSRDSGRTWHRWKDFRGSSVLPANQDASTPVRNELAPPIVGANVIRISPYSHHLRTVCLRFELHGCPHDEGAPVAYESQDGLVDPRWGHLNDYTYDGVRQRGRLSGGLGQLVDGVKGMDNFSHNLGLEWVGWKSMQGDVELEFTFRSVRNFTGALFHSNNLFSAGVEVFQGVDVHYGLDVALATEPLREQLRWRRGDFEALSSQPEVGQQQTLWSPDTNNIDYEPDKKSESARPVRVHLKQRLANKLKFVLKFASKWILVSEVEFISTAVELLNPLQLAATTEAGELNQVQALLQSLQSVQAYDEFVAILREHQLRRNANAYLKSFIGAGGSPSTSTQLPLESSITPTSADEGNLLLGMGVDPSSPLPPALMADDPPSQPDSPQLDPRLVVATPTQDNNNPMMPATNPLLRVGDPYNSGFFPQPPQVAMRPPSININDNQQLGGDQQQQQQRQRHLGLATVIALVLVGLLLLLGALFLVSSYRLRAQGPKLGHLPRHLGAPPSSGSSLGKSGLHSFMSSLLNHHHSPQSTLGGHHQHHLGAHQQDLMQHQHQFNHLQQQQQQPEHFYNAIFATNERPQQQHQRHNNNQLLSQQQQHQTLKRLASLQKSNQLLVSVKDTSRSLFNRANLGSASYRMGSGGQQAVSTQLIVGLNQANPLAQQQIYQQTAAPPSSNQTYATNYYASMSMASSSTATNTTTGGGGRHQADYAGGGGGDYAIPDASPILFPTAASSHHHNNNLAPL